MKNLSNIPQRGKAIAEHFQRESKRSETEKHDHTYEGQPVTVVDTFSRDGKRIAVVVDRDGDQFEVFMEQLS